MGDLRPQGSMGPVGVEFGNNVSRGTLLPDTKGKVPYSGYNEMVMKAFLASNDDKLPEDISELNAFIKYSKPDWPMFNDAQFKAAIASVQLGRKITGQKEMAAVAKERRKQALDTENAIVNRIAKIEDDELKNAADIVSNKDFSMNIAYVDTDENPTPKGQALLDGTYAKKEAEKRIATDSKLKTLRERQSKLTELIERPQPQAAKKERPSGGGGIVVTGKPKSAKDAKQGTILTTQGAYGEAKQYKLTPVDKFEEGKPYAGRYRVSRPKPGTFNTWEDGGEITADEVYARTRGAYGTPKPPDEAPVQEIPEHWLPDRAAAQELPVPPTPGGESVYEEYGMDPRMEEPIVAPKPRQTLLPPGYPGIDEEYVDPYAGYQYDEKDVTELGLTPRGFYRELFGY